MTDRANRLPGASVLGIIPARGGSKGLPGKNLVPLGGVPLIAHTILAARRSRLLNDLVLSTDSEAIAESARSFGLSVDWLRPPELAGDASRVQEAIRHALTRHPGSARFEYILLLQPTAPLREARDIDNSIRLAARYGADSVVSLVLDPSRHPYLACRIEPGGPGRPPRAHPLIDSEPGQPRQEFPECGFRNGAIYLFRRRFFLQADSFISPDCVPYLMPRRRSVNVDSAEDIAYAEYLINRRGPSS